MNYLFQLNKYSVTECNFKHEFQNVLNIKCAFTSVLYTNKKTLKHLGIFALIKALLVVSFITFLVYFLILFNVFSLLRITDYGHPMKAKIKDI